MKYPVTSRESRVTSQGAQESQVTGRAGRSAYARDSAGMEASS